MRVFIFLILGLHKILSQRRVQITQQIYNNRNLYHTRPYQFVGGFIIDFMLLGSSVIAALHYAYLANVMITVTIFTINYKTLTTIVNMHMACSLFSQLFHVIAQYIIQMASVIKEMAIKYQSLVFCLGYLQSQSRSANPKSGRL